MQAVSTPLFLEFERVAQEYAHRPAIVDREESYTYGRLLDQSRALALRLQHDGDIRLHTGEAVLLVSENCVHWPLASLAIQATGAVEFPRETSIAPEELRDLRRLTGARLIFLQNEALLPLLEPAGTATDSEAEELIVVLMEIPPRAESASPSERPARMDLLVKRLDRLLEAQPGPRELQRFARVAGDDAASATKRTNKAQSADGGDPLDPLDPLNAIAAVIRTSGTTGPPKLVALSHRNFLHGMRTIPQRLELEPEDRFLSCLPPWHLFARLEHYAAFQAGSSLHYCGFEEITSKLRSVRPTIFPGFPEIWERVYHGVRMRVQERGLLARTFFEAGLRVSIAYRRCRDRGQTAPLLGLLNRLAAVLIHRGIHAQLGGKLRAAIIGDAPLPPRIDETLRALGIPVLEGYGSTEQCVTTLRSVRRNRIGAAGPPLAETQVRIRAKDGRPAPAGVSGDILVAGPQIFPGYYRGPGGLSANEGDFCDFEGERHYITGDVGLLTPDGDLRVLGRRKNEFALADGTVVHPEIVEDLFRTLPYVDRAIVAGRAQAAPVALLSPEFPAVIRYLRDQAPSRIQRLIPPRLRRLQERQAKQRHRDQARLRRILIRMPVVQYLFLRESMRALQASGLDPGMMPDRIVLLDRPFEVGRELTPTLKPRRPTIEAMYAAQTADAGNSREVGATLPLTSRAAHRLKREARRQRRAAYRSYRISRS